MFRNILSTTLVKVTNTLVAFVILMINARTLGAENLGTIGLILLAITIILLLNNLIGGAGLVFLIPRFSLRHITRISWLWSAIASVIGILIFKLLKVEPADYATDIFFLSLIMGLNFVNQNILVGKSNIRFFNLISFIQYMMMIILMVILFYVLKKPSIANYLLTLYVSWGLNLLLGTIKILGMLRTHQVTDTQGLFKALLRYGFFVQIANLTQFFNYRLTYYFVESYLGRASLGIFEIGNKFADGIWLFGKSISLVQYSWISNATQDDDPVLLTVRLFKFTSLLTLLLVGGMLLLPEQFYLALFGHQYAGLYHVLLLLSPGIVFIASSMILAHHFAGTGKHYINTICSLIGLGAVVLLCLILVPSYGLAGAALAASITYCISLVYNLIIFTKITRVPLSAFTFRKGDIIFLKDLIKRQIAYTSKNHQSVE